VSDLSLPLSRPSSLSLYLPSSCRGAVIELFCWAPGIYPGQTGTPVPDTQGQIPGQVSRSVPTKEQAQPYQRRAPPGSGRPQWWELQGVWADTSPSGEAPQERHSLCPHKVSLRHSLCPWKWPCSPRLPSQRGVLLREAGPPPCPLTGPSTPTPPCLSPQPFSTPPRPPAAPGHAVGPRAPQRVQQPPNPQQPGLLGCRHPSSRRGPRRSRTTRPSRSRAYSPPRPAGAQARGTPGVVVLNSTSKAGEESHPPPAADPHLISSVVYIPKETPASRRHGTTFGGLMANERVLPGPRFTPLCSRSCCVTGGTTRSRRQGASRAGPYHRRGGAASAPPRTAGIVPPSFPEGTAGVPAWRRGGWAAAPGSKWYR